MAVHQYSRDKLEENRRKQAAAQAAAQKALQSGAAFGFLVPAEQSGLFL